jgi:subtilisin family serine protease
MGYPAAYAPVISAAAAGWTGQWLAGSDGVAGNWWWSDDVADPTDADDFYITDFSGRARPGQDLDVAAPGIWVVGPYQINHRTAPSYFYLSGTSMASPHVAGIVALLAQQNPSLTQTDAESTLEATAILLPPGSRTVTLPGGATATYSWDVDATGAGLVDAEAALGLGVLATTKGKRN